MYKSFLDRFLHSELPPLFFFVRYMDFGPPRIFKAIDLSIFRFKTRKNDNSIYSFKKTLLKLIDSILVSWKLHSWLFENSEINIYLKVFEIGFILANNYPWETMEGGRGRVITRLPEGIFQLARLYWTNLGGG